MILPVVLIALVACAATTASKKPSSVSAEAPIVLTKTLDMAQVKELLKDCQVPKIKLFGVTATVELANDRLAALKKCNVDKAKLRDIFGLTP